MTDVITYQLPRPELQADIYYLTEKESGRRTHVGSGYRGQFYYDGKNFVAQQQFIDKEWCELGDTAKVLLQTGSPQFHVGQLYVGKEFEIREGARIVGKGTITHVLRQDFNYWDGKTFLANLDSNVLPYNGDDLHGYEIDFDHYLTETGLISNIDFEMTGNPECMILVKM